MTRQDVAELVVRMAVDNPRWGYTRIRGALSNLGHTIARTTVKRILHDHGVDPAPERSRHMPWKTFLQAHGEGLAACDLFTVEVVDAGGAQAVPRLLRDRAEIPPRDHRRDPPAAGRRVDGAAGPQFDRPGRWLFAQGAPSDSRPRSPLYAGLWRDPGERRCSADSAAAEESQSQRLCRAVRQVDQRGVSHTRGPARRGASASSRLRVHRTRPSRAKPPGTRQPAPATTTTSAKAGRRRSAAGTPRRITQFLQSRGRMRGRPIKRTLRHPGLSDASEGTGVPESRGEVGVQDSEHHDGARDTRWRDDRMTGRRSHGRLSALNGVVHQGMPVAILLG